MALQTLNNGIFIPSIRHADVDGFVTTDYLIDASGEKAAVIVRVPKTGTISKVVFRTGTVTSSETLRVSLQTVTSGEPSGTDYGGSAAGTQATPASNTVYTVTLGTAATGATKGDVIAIVFEFDSAVGNLTFSSIASSGQYSGSEFTGFPYSSLYTVSWANPNARTLSACLEYSDGSYENMGVLPFSSIGSVSFNSSTTPDERALRFNLPFPCRIIGYWFLGDLEASADIVLYEGTTAQLTQSLDFNERGQPGGSQRYLNLFDSSYNIIKDTVYYLALKPTTTTSVGLSRFTVETAAMMDCFNGGQNLYLGTRTDAGAWTDTTTERPFMGIIVDQFDDGVGGAGGMIVHPGMSGGTRG
jgi:hypothetical protein